MTIKKLSAEGRFECGIDDVVEGKVWAFVAVVPPDGSYIGLGAAAANEPGYWPIPRHWANGDDFAEMQTHADELNEALGLTCREAAHIIASSMAAGSIKDIPLTMPKRKDDES